MNSIQNISPEYPKHPLKGLMRDSLRATTCGACSDRLIKAYDVKGWRHDFVRWEGVTSVEELSWDNEEVFNKLVEIYK
jgi:hypothetical protein